MDTPRTVNRAHRPPLGTPTVSNSKKSLFGKDVEDGADIGPITPLRFGSHQKKQRKSNNALSNITSFRNLFGNESPDSERSLSPDFERRYTNNGRYELVSADFDKENMAHAVDEETRFSFSSSIPETPCSRLSAEESAVLDENNSNSLSMLMNSDLNLVEKRSKALHRTPGVTTRSHSAKTAINQRSVDPCLRRMQQQHLQGVKRAHNGTPDNSSQSPSYAEIERSTAKRPNTRARTALHFNDILPIPTKSFYSSAPAEKDTPVKVHAPISTKSFYASSSSKSATIVATHHSSPENAHSVPSTHETPAVKQASTSKTPRKATSMRKRSKSFSSNAPRLGQRGTVHKIRKPVKKSTESQTPKKRGSKNQQKNRAIAGGTKSCPTTPKSGSNTLEPDHDEMLRQLKHVNRILRQGQKNLTSARPLSISRSMTDLSKGWLSCGEEANSSSSEDEDSASEQEDGNGHTKRKFFRSSRKSRSNRRVYNHLNSIAIGVQKGGKRKVLSFPQAPKRRRIGFAQDDFDFENEQLEVDDLISKLDEGAGCIRLESEQFHDTESHFSTMQDQHDEDDEPIPIQSNIIYLSADDEYALENNRAEESMENLESNRRNGMIIIHHSDAEVPVDIVEEDESILHPCHYDTVPAGNEQYADFITNSSTIIIQHNKYHSSSTSFHNDSSISTTIMNSSTVSQYQYASQCQASDAAQTTTNQEAYYPIFYSDRVKELWRQERQQQTANEQTDVFHLLRQQDNYGRGIKSNSQRRYGVGQDQYQIDAGQRAYGAIQCKECGLTYSTNEPEEELFHDNFHRSHAKLIFTGAPNEHVVAQVPEWDVTGRIIVVSQTDSNKHLLKKIQGVLEVVDSELGFSTQGELPEGACVYLAIARSTVLGICVVQPLQYANRMVCLEGLHGVPIDCYSSEFYPARCGISRLWVAPKYRRHGIGRRLVGSIRHHYIFGYTMTLDEIAFGAPTEMGKLFAESVCERKDFLVYI